MILKSYCYISGLPVGLALGFHGCKSLAGFAGRVRHPLFDYPLSSLMRAVPNTLDKLSAEEQKLLLCALSYKLDLWEVREHLTVEASLCGQLLDYLISLVPEIIRSPMVVTTEHHVTNKKFPKLRIDSQTTKLQLASHYKIIAECLEGKRAISAEEQLDWEIELEAALNRTLKAGSGYTPRLGKWAIATLADANIRNLVTDDELACVQTCLDTPADWLRETQLKAAIETCLRVLPCNDDIDRENSLYVVRAIEKKLEILVKERADFDIVDLVDVQGAATKDSIGASYTVKAGIEKEAKVITATHKAKAKDMLIQSGVAFPNPIQIMLKAKELLAAETTEDTNL